MSKSKPKILLTFQENGQNGGPYISHKRIMESELSKEFDIKPLMIPRSRYLLNPMGMIRFIKGIKKEKPEAVQVTGLQLEGFLSTIGCKLAGVKVLVAVHGSATQACGLKWFEKKIYSYIEKLTVKMADGIFGVSDYVAAWDVCKYAKKNYGRIYNIVRFEENSENSDSLTTFRKETGIREDDIVVTSTGRITTDKGYDILWDAIQKLEPKENVKFVIVGDGNYKDEFVNQVENSAYKNNVIFTGYRSDVHAILKESDIFVICTKHETLCISLLEAAINQLPMIASDVGGIPEIVDDSCGSLVEVGDAEGFAQAISEYANDEDLRKEKGARAKEKITKDFNEEKTIIKLSRVYKSVLKGPKRCPDRLFSFMNIVLTLYLVEAIFPPITVIVKPVIVCFICLLAWLVLSFTKDPDFYLDIKKNKYVLYPMVFYFISILIPYVAGEGTFGNRYAALALIPMGYIIFNFYQKHKKLHHIKNILIVTGGFVAITFVKTLAALIEFPYISRSIKSSGEHTEELYRQGIGGYSFVYFIALCSILVLFIALKERKNKKGIMFFLIYFVLMFFVLKSNYVTALLIAVCCSIILACIELINKKTIGIFAVVFAVAIVGLIFLEEIIGVFAFIIPKRIAEVLVSGEGETILGSIAIEFMEDRFPLMKDSIDAYLAHPIGGIVINNAITFADGNYVGFGQHSHILDTFALLGTTLGVLNIFVLFRPFKDSNGKFIKNNRSLNITMICAVIVTLLFNNATEAIGMSITIIYPLVREYYSVPAGDIRRELP